MKHFHDLTVLTTHTAIAPLAYTFKIDKGLITWCGTFFPPGCHGRVYTKIYFQAHQIIPRNQESWCHGNNGWWQGFLYFPVTAEPLQIKVEAYSVAAIYSHTVTIGLELTPWEQVPAWDKLITLIRHLIEAIGLPLPPPKVTEMTV